MSVYKDTNWCELKKKISINLQHLVKSERSSHNESGSKNFTQGFLTSTPQTLKGSLNNLHRPIQVCVCVCVFNLCVTVSKCDSCHGSPGTAVLFILHLLLLLYSFTPSDPRPDIQKDSCFLLAKLTLPLSLRNTLTHAHTHTEEGV